MNITDQINPACPFLGLEDDADSSQAFPSASNYCHHSNPIAPVKLDHQSEFCLSGKYPACPVFLRQQIGPLPGSIRIHGSHAKKIRWVSLRNIIAIVIALIVIIMFEWQFLAQTKLSPIKTAPPDYTASIAPAETFTPTPAATLALLLPAAFTSTPTLHVPFFGSVTVTSSPTLTPTITSTKFISKHQLDVQIGTDHKFIIHRLSGHERLDPYLQQYNTSIEAVKSINYYLYLTNPVRNDVLIVFPFNFTDVSGMPVLIIYQIQESERGIDYEYLAQHLHVSLDDLKYYNGITDPGDRPLVGDYLLIPQERLVP